MLDACGINDQIPLITNINKMISRKNLAIAICTKTHKYLFLLIIMVCLLTPPESILSRMYAAIQMIQVSFGRVKDFKITFG